MINATKQLSYDELRSIVWAFADKIRDNGHGEVADYMPITIGTLMLKRIIDERTHFKKEILMNKETVLDIVDNNFDEYVANLQSENKSFAVKDDALWSYRLDWEDIAKFPDNTKNLYTEIKYRDSDIIKNSGVSLNTETYIPKDENKFKILNKTNLIRYIAQSFVNPLYSKMFKIFDFTSKIGVKENDEDGIILDEKFYSEILNDLNQYDFSVTGTSHDVFADVYMDLLGRFAEDGGKKGGEFFTPTSVVRGAIKFIDFDRSLPHVKIGDPAAGACSFIIEAVKEFVNGDESRKQDVEVVFGEKSVKSGVIGGTNISLHGIERSISFYDDSIKNYRKGIGKYSHSLDYVFANPPYGLKDYGYSSVQETDEMWKYGVPKKGDGDYAFMEVILDLLNDRGQAIVVLPMGTLFKNTTQNIRKNILETGWVSGIVALPERLFRTTSIPVCLWVLNKNRKDLQEGKPGVMMINAFNDFVREGKFNHWTPEMSDKASRVFKNKETIEGYSRYVDFQTIIDNKYNLSIDKYIDSEEVEEIIDIQEVTSNIKKLRMELFADLIAIEKSLEGE